MPETKHEVGSDTMAPTSHCVREVVSIYKGRPVKMEIMNQPSKAAGFARIRIGSFPREAVICLYLNTKLELLAWNTVSLGAVNMSTFDMREIFFHAIKHYASSIILTHNHPSGGVKPSVEDIAITHRVQETGKIIGVPLVDHIIVTENDFYSLKENGHFKGVPNE